MKLWVVHGFKYFTPQYLKVTFNATSGGKAKTQYLSRNFSLFFFRLGVQKKNT